MYVGETSRFAKTRINEHFTRKESAVYKHYSTYHSQLDIYTLFNTKILHTNLIKYKHRLFVESMYIKQYKDSLMKGCADSSGNTVL